MKVLYILSKAINLALNPFDRHFVDRDLSRTGLSIVLITPGTGIFEGLHKFNAVDKALCRMTDKRMADNGISLDLVCLSKPPLHSSPLFQFVKETSAPVSTGYSTHQKSFERGSGESLPYLNNSRNNSKKSDGLMNSYYKKKFGGHGSNAKIMEKGSAGQHSNFENDPDDNPTTDMEPTFAMSHWIYCSYWSRSTSFRRFVPRCKMYEVQMMAFLDDDEKNEIDIPPLMIPPLSSNGIDPSQEMQAYDDMAFRNDPITPLFKYNGTVDETEESPRLLPTHERRSVKSTSHSLEADHFKLSSPDDTMKHLSYNSEPIEYLNASLQPIKIRHSPSKRFSNARSTAHVIGSFSESEREMSPGGNPTFRQSSRRASLIHASKTAYQQSLLNPWNPEKSLIYGDGNVYRWGHVSPKQHNTQQLLTDWKSLCTPACLPLTTDFFPSPEQLSQLYQEFTYTVSLADEGSFQADTQDTKKVESFLVELVRQR